MRHRILHLADEEERVKGEIAETRERTKERKDLAGRMQQIKKVDDETKTWMNREIEQRRQVISDQRMQSRRAIEAKRIALLEARHADFMAKKHETAQARATILQARAAKQQQKQAQMLSVRERQARAREHNKQLEQEKQQSQSAQAAILHAQEAAEVNQSLRELDDLAREEQRLLDSVLHQHAQHRKEFDALQTRLPAYRRGLHTNPAPFSLPQPLARDSPLLDRRPVTSLGSSRTEAISAFGNSPAANFGNSGRFSGNYSYGNSTPSSPRSARRDLIAPIPPASVPSSPRSRLGSRPGSASFRAPGAT